MGKVRLRDLELQFQSRVAPADQLPGLELSSDLVNALAHMAAVEGGVSKLLAATDGALHVTGAGFDALELALVGAGDKGLDDLFGEVGALELALVGAGDVGLDDVQDELAGFQLATCGMTGKGFPDVLTALAPLVSENDERPLANYFDSVQHVEPFYGSTSDKSIADMAEVTSQACETIAVILTDVWDEVNHCFRTQETV